MEQWTFGKKIMAGFGVSVAILIAIAVVTFRTTDALIENNHYVAHSHAVLEGVERVFSSLKDSETGQRGYLLTGEESYLAPYLSGTTEVRRAVSDVKTLVGDNAAQSQRIAQAEVVAETKLVELAQTIEMRRAQGLDAALAVVKTGRGKEAMDNLRAILTQMELEERMLLKQHADAAESSARAAKTTIIVGSLAALLATLIAGYVIVRSLSQQLGTAVANMRSSSTELQAAATQQATGSKEQSTAATEVSTTIRELLSTSHQIAESSQRVARVADETMSAARAGDQTVQFAHESIGGIKRQVDLVVGHMLDLGRKSQQAGGILDLVNELSDQTNILAINATIEAAGAGEHGKRFSVVADEIRKLADRVSGSTKEIRALIEDMRSAVNSTVMATESGAKAVDAGTRQFTELNTTFKRIVGLVSTTSEAAREIELSTKQQATAVEQVNMAIVNVAQATRETETSSTQTLQIATQLTELSGRVMRLVQRDAA